MRTVCAKDMCAGCMACVDICACNAISVHDDLRAYNAVIDVDKCVNCGLCERVCQQNHPASLREPLEWKQGWAVDSEERATSSSGGAAAALSKVFLERGGVVCSCTFRGGRFGFEIAESEDDLKRFKGSKYVKSDPTGAYRAVRSLLRAGRSVLFIGLPCQVSSMRNFCHDDEGLHTVDLICHGTPSPKILERFLVEHGFNVNDASDIGFRRKARFAIRDGEATVDVPGVTDRYSIAFLNGLDYTENCYSCAYAQQCRASDITIGDSWGTNLLEETPMGVSLVLYQTEKGKDLVEASGLKLVPVNQQRALDNNGQLCHPSVRPKQRERFFLDINYGNSVATAVSRAFPSQCLKQDVKKILVKAGLWKPSGGALRDSSHRVR